MIAYTKEPFLCRLENKGTGKLFVLSSTPPFIIFSLLAFIIALFINHNNYKHL
jgi:hypothetical protein